MLLETLDAKEFSAYRIFRVRGESRRRRRKSAEN